MPRELNPTQARRELPALVQDAERGVSTLITPRGATSPVAAVVPAHVAQNHTAPRTPDLPEGRAGSPAPDTEADQTWTEAALVALQHQFTQAQSALVRAQEQLNAARILAVDQQAASAREMVGASTMAQALADVARAGAEAVGLRDALDAPSPAECVECGQRLEYGSQGWEHTTASGAHTPVVRRLPPARPAIRGGRVDTER